MTTTLATFILICASSNLSPSTLVTTIMKMQLAVEVVDLKDFNSPFPDEPWYDRALFPGTRHDPRKFWDSVAEGFDWR
jgi:hypothetical protein